MRALRSTLLALGLTMALGPSSGAQILRGALPDTTTEETETGRTPGRRSDFQLRSSGGFGFMQTRPLGGLARNINFGYGASGNYVYRLDKAGILGIRLGGSMSGYGVERMRVPLSSTIGGRVQVNVTTTNTIGTLSLGPQLMLPVGFIRPYANVGIGVIGFATTSSVSDFGNYEEDVFETRNHSDGTATWTAGTGIHIPLSHGRTKVLLDLGVEYFYGGEASYLRRGSIVDLPNNQIQINSFRSETRFLNVSLGMRITP